MLFVSIFPLFAFGRNGHIHGAEEGQGRLAAARCRRGSRQWHTRRCLSRSLCRLSLCSCRRGRRG